MSGNKWNQDIIDEKVLNDCLEQTCYGQCPYYIKESKSKSGILKVSCEGATLKLPDKKSRREFVYTYCAHPCNYKTCPIYQYMDSFYKRKFEKERSKLWH